MHDTEAEMGGCFPVFWVECESWRFRRGPAGHVWQSLFCESRVFIAHAPLFWTVSWYFKHAGSISVCWNNLDHKKTHMGRTEMKHRKVCTGKPQYFFSLAEVNLGFIILFKADVLHRLDDPCRKTYWQTQRVIWPNADLWVVWGFWAMLMFTAGLVIEHLSHALYMEILHILERFEKEEGNGARERLSGTWQLSVLATFSVRLVQLLMKNSPSW